ncbi:MAG: HypC/HybG/HupF family hydrogenase formation chaperone [Dehalococcoidia bacterium]|nr:MAG: HypC/HybG/HupF family hydrogenase formation chaperone [Dehalococcoidia bacterium]
MCIAVPGKVISLDAEGARVDVSGHIRTASTIFAPEVQVGDYVVISGGMIVDRLDEKEALDSLSLFEDLLEVLDETS